MEREDLQRRKEAMGVVEPVGKDRIAPTAAQRKLNREYTVLKGEHGDILITLNWYLPRRTCTLCKQKQPAAEFIKAWRRERGIALLFDKKFECNTCTPPSRLFPDLCTPWIANDFVDDAGNVVGWYERTRTATGDLHSARRLEFRKDKRTGIWCPQPTFERGLSREFQTGTPLFDSTRGFDDFTLILQCIAQGWKCGLCGEPFEGNRGPEADHSRPHARGGCTIDENCSAKCESCNRFKRTMSEEEAMRKWKLDGRVSNMPKTPEGRVRLLTYKGWTAEEVKTEFGA